MSMFLSKALRRAEVFLEQVDESVAQASRRLVVEGAVGDVDETDDELDSADEQDDRASHISRASSIPKAHPSHVADAPDAPDAAADASAPAPTASSPDEAAAEAAQPSAESAHQREKPVEAQQLESQDVAQPPVDPALQPSVAADTAQNNTETDGIDAAVAAVAPSSSHAQSDTTTVAESSSQISVSSSAALTALSPSDAMISIPAAVPEPVAAAPEPPIAKPATVSEPVAPVAKPSAAPPAADEYVAALNQENSALRQELEQLEDSFEKGRRERSKLMKNLKRMKEIVAEMDESLQEKSAEARTAQDELEKLRDELSALRTASVQDSARGKDSLDLLRKELTAQISTLTSQADAAARDANDLRQENERLKEAMLQGREVDLATADGARQDASQAHRAYEAETLAHRETRRLAKEREESLQGEAAVATVALANAQRKAEEAVVAMNTARTMQRTAEGKVGGLASARDAAFARIEDLESALRMYDSGDGQEAPGQREAKAMQQTVSELENALEAKNVELNRLEGEVESLRAAMKHRRDGTSPRAGAGRSENSSHVDVEVKLRHMADSSLRKQAQLEVLRSENRALQQQLTTERKRTREAQAMAAAASSSRQSIRGGFRGLLDPGESERGDRLYGVRDGPLARFRAPRSWPRAVATLLTGLDRVSAQGLAFLRKEPLLRIVVVVYLVMLHVFVYSVLHWHVDAVAGGRVGGKAVVGAAGLAAKAVDSAVQANAK